MVDGAADEVTIGGRTTGPGETRDLQLEIGSHGTAPALEVPVRVIRGQDAGPRIFVTAVIHGDELNGLGVLRRLMGRRLDLRCGTLVLAPVCNPFGFFAHTRYLPDRRDLNRCFPGKRRGSAGSRLAALLFDEIVRESDAGIDIHTATRGRSNTEHVRIGLRVPGACALARRFGAEIILDHPSRPGTLRWAAGRAGIPVLLVESGDPYRFQEEHVRWVTGGILSVLRACGMLDGPLRRPSWRVIFKKTRWIRADAAGILEMQVRPRQLVRSGAPLGALYDLQGQRIMTITAPEAGLVLGVSTYPSASVGDAVCHLGVARRSWDLLEKRLDPTVA